MYSVKIKILVAAHKPYWMPGGDCYLPIHVGCAGKQSIGFQGDDTGDNISAKKTRITAAHRALLGVEEPAGRLHRGLVHYRCSLLLYAPRGAPRRGAQTGNPDDSRLGTAPADHPVIVPDKRRYYIESNRSHYNHAHHTEGLDLAEQIIAEQFPAYMRHGPQLGAHVQHVRHAPRLL